MSRDRYRLSFDSIAETYERARPGYAADAVAWVAERLPLGRVLDLGAGTGKLTRQLLALGAEVVAVEPGGEMRRVLERVVPEATALAGSAESIPLPDGSVDAVTVGQAFHWFDTEPALAEIHRVLRAGGGYAFLWNEWSDGSPFQRQLDALVAEVRPADARDGSRRTALETTPLFRMPEERRFEHAQLLSPDELVERISSVSAVAAAAPEERERILAQVRELAGTGRVEFPMTTTVLVADRV